MIHIDTVHGYRSQLEAGLLRTLSKFAVEVLHLDTFLRVSLGVCYLATKGAFVD